jgi:hypothetical protein
MLESQHEITELTVKVGLDWQEIFFLFYIIIQASNNFNITSKIIIGKINVQSKLPFTLL